MTDWVLDASAVLALLNRESGADRVAEAMLDEAVMSAVNLSEVVAKLAEFDRGEAEIQAVLDGLGIDIVDLDESGAYESGMLRPATRSAGLSFGDRACLALARRLGAPAMTADRVWGELDLGIAVTMIR